VKKLIREKSEEGQELVIIRRQIDEK